MSENIEGMRYKYKGGPEDLEEPPPREKTLAKALRGSYPDPAYEQRDRIIELLEVLVAAQMAQAKESEDLINKILGEQADTLSSSQDAMERMRGKQ